jgi:hypothetical protein
MTVTEAKRVLIACRPGSADLRSAEAEAALALMAHHPELREWWERQQSFFQETRRSLRDIPAPAHLREKILSRTKVVAFPWWRQKIVWSAAAAAIVMLGAIVFWQEPRAENSFGTFRSRVVRSVLREYRMDITTKDMAQVRQFLSTRQAPADYALPAGLASMPVMGAGVLSWQDRKVSMVCLDSITHGPLFLFIVEASSLSKPPAAHEAASIKEMNTVSWTNDGKTYVLASHAEKGWLERQLPMTQ